MIRKRWTRRFSFRFVFIFLGVFILGGEFQETALAWDADAHYALTYYIALHVGYTPRQAFQIASASYAIDEDRDCEPIPREANLEYALSVAIGQPPAPSHRRWKFFHAFSLDGMPLDQAEREFRDDCNYLWQFAVADRNPGPDIHLNQDYYAHFFWDTKRGHMFAGHSVDYLSYILEDSKKMAIATIAELSKFMREVLHKKPLEVPWERISAVIDKLSAANPTPTYLTKDNFDPKILPDLNKALAVINQVVDEDVQNGLLPRWPNEPGWQSPNWLQSVSLLEDWMKLNGVEEFQPLPQKWYQFDFNSQGQIVKNSLHADAYAVEEISLVLGKEKVEIRKLDEYNVQVTLQMPYKISGVKNIPVIAAPPLPVLEVHQLAKRLPSGLLNREVEPKVFLRHRGNGDIVAELNINLPEDSLKSQNLVWECTIYLSGLPPKIAQINLKAEPVSKSAETGTVTNEPPKAGDWVLKDVKIHKPSYVLYDHTYYRSEAAMQKTSARLTAKSWDKEDTYNWTLDFKWSAPPADLRPGSTFTIIFQGNANASIKEKCTYSWIGYAWAGFDVKINGESPRENRRDLHVGMTSTKEWVPFRSETATFTVPANAYELAIYVWRGDSRVEFVYEKKK